MPLPIRDGNQSLTTLSTILVSNAHIPAHTVVSLGTQAITDIVNATSAGLTNTQLRASAVTIVGSVFVSQPPVSTARLGVNLVDSSGTGNYGTDGSPFKISGTKSSDEDTTQLPTLPVQLVDLSEQIIGVSSNPLPISGTVTIGSALPAGTNRIGVVTIGGGTVTIGASTAQIGSVTASISNSLTISSLPAISGTVTANVTTASLFNALENYNQNWNDSFPVAIKDVPNGIALPTDLVDSSGDSRFANGALPISGTVTANLDVDQIDQLNFSAFARINDENGNPVNNGNPLPISGTVTIGNTVNFLSASDTDTNLVENISSAIAANNILGITNALPAGTNRIGVVTIGAGTVTIGAGTAQIGSVTASISGTVPISISSVTVGNSVTIASLPAISGTVTANLGEVSGASGDPLPAKYVLIAGKNQNNEIQPIGISGDGTINLPVGIETLATITDGDGNLLYLNNGNIPISGTVTLSEFVSVESSEERLIGTTGGNVLNAGIGISFNLGGASSIVGTSNPFPISGTVTANSSNGSLTTQFGSVVTANIAFATSAVTNANRKYLLIQNITTASNVITVGIGFTPTTTQGIQLFAGAGLTFEGTYIPTGAVNLLSSVTASCYTILEA